MRSLICSLLMLTLAVPWVAARAQSTGYAGRPLSVVLDELRERGAPLVYSSNLVPRRLRVESEPQATEQLALVRELLAPHGLAIQESGGAWLVVRGNAPPPPPQGTGAATITVEAVASAAAVTDAIVQLDAPSGPSVALVAGRAAFGNVAAGRHTFTVRAPGYLPDRASVDVVPGATAELALQLAVAAPPLEELTVTASRYSLRDEVQSSTSYFSQEQIENLTDFGDVLRVAHRLPGIATSELSSRSHVRGGAVDEMTVVLDGMKLFEPFHLRDYQSVFSAIDQRIVSGIEVYSGGFPVAYGDALSGLTVIDRLEPMEPLHHELGLSLLYTSLLSAGTFDDGRAQWLVSARRGNIDELLQDGLGEPSYRDAFVHLGFTLNSKHRIALNDIGFDDDILLTPDNSPSDREMARSDTDTNQLWLKVDSDWTEALSSRSIVYTTDFTGERRGVVADLDDLVGLADDVRELEARGFKQDWRWDASERQLWTWGLETEELDGRYAYASAVDMRGVLATLEAQPRRSSAVVLAPEGESHGVYVSDRVRLSDRAIADLGVRWDKQTYLPPGDDEQFSPRGSFLYRLAGRTDLRFSYGRFFQSESLVDLQVEDGVTEFAPAQSASHTIAGVDHRFAGNLTLRVEIFRKWTTNARPRYENLFDPLVLLPELRPGRVRIAPERAESRGLEALVSSGGEIDWWAGYSFARAVDIVDGERVARSWDQRHALTGGVTWQTGPWTLTGVATLHTGWPATTVELVPSTAANAVEGMVAVAGPRNADRLRPMRRLDFRASRTFEAGPGTVRFFAELENVTNRANPCCVSYEAVSVPGQPLRLDRVERRSLPLTGNVGALWEF